jgi:hypothetical protein
LNLNSDFFGKVAVFNWGPELSGFGKKEPPTSGSFAALLLPFDIAIRICFEIWAKFAM